MKERFPAWVEVEEFAKVGRDLAKKEPAKNRDESRGPSTAIFDEDEARKVIEQAERVYGAYSRLLKRVAGG